MLCARCWLQVSGKHSGATRSGRRAEIHSLTSPLSASWSEPDRGPAPVAQLTFCCSDAVEGAVFLWTVPNRDAANENAARALEEVRPQGVSVLRALRGSKGIMRPKKTILCVDDNEQGLAVRKFLLETRGYRVVSVASAHDAIEVLRAGGIDLVLGDLIMPQMDGNEMVQRMKEIAPEVPMVLLSGTVKQFERASHADAFLPKGACSPVELLERIRVMIARKRGPRKVLVVPDPFGSAFAAAIPATSAS